MNSQKTKIIRNIMDHSFEYLFKLIDEYNVKSAHMTFYCDYHNDDDIVEARKAVGRASRMYTILSACGDDDSDIIGWIRGHIYMSYESLLELIFECDMNIDKVIASMEFAIRHEIGHILYNDNRFAGKTVDK